MLLSHHALYFSLVIILFFDSTSTYCRANPNPNTSLATSKKLWSGLSQRNGRPVEFFQTPMVDDGLNRGISKLPLTTTAQAMKKRTVSHVKASMLTIILFGLLAHSFWFSVSIFTRNRAIMIGITLLLYIVESATCSTRRYLSNAITPVQMNEYLEQLKLSPPSIWWEIVCYHYRNHTTYRRLSNGTTRRHQERVRVTTHRAQQQYVFQSWNDVTDSSMISIWNNRNGGDDFSSTTTSTVTKSFAKITISKMLLFSSESSYLDYLNQFSKFQKFHDRDVHRDITIHFDVEGYLPKILAIHGGLGGKGTGLFKSNFWFWLWTMFGMTVPYRILFSRHCKDFDVILTKKVTS